MALKGAELLRQVILQSNQTQRQNSGSSYEEIINYDNL